MTRLQEIWNKRIRSSSERRLRYFTESEKLQMAHEGGPMWIYEQDPHNTDAYREGWERIFGKKEKVNG